MDSAAEQHDIAPAGAEVTALRPPGSLLVPGRTCWRVEPAHRVAFLIDGQNYFRAAIEAMSKARRSIALLAWDLDLRIAVEPGSDLTLLAFLERLIAERPELHIRILLWDMANALALIRPMMPPVLQDWVTSERLHLESDSAHPAGSCQHQKVLVIDDAVAFCGGVDFSGNRWDSRAHLPDDPRRRLPEGTPYEPRHDIMMAVDGAAAQALGDLFRHRWLRATGERLERVRPEGDRWPSGLQPDLQGVTVGLARTSPQWENWEEAHEVEALYVAAIRAARRWIFIENQYFASRRIAEEIGRRLTEPDGPEVVVITSAWGPSWLEHQTMNTLRDRIVGELRDIDRYGRFRVYAPFTGRDRGIVIHSKLMIVDDRLVRVGSANLNERSMGVDTECDLAVEAVPGSPNEAAVQAAIRRLCTDLVAEHLGLRKERVTRMLLKTGSLIRTIERLRRWRHRRLRPLATRKLGPIHELVDNILLNPVRPLLPMGMKQVLLTGALGAAGGWLLWRAWRGSGGGRIRDPDVASARDAALRGPARRMRR